MRYGATAAECSLANGPRIRSMPADGCSAWERQPGADDEPDRVPTDLSAAGARG